MRRIFWDAPVLIYLTEGNVDYVERVTYLVDQSLSRKDELITSWVALGEILVGVGRKPGLPDASAMRRLLDALGFTYLDFDGKCVETYRFVRSTYGVKPPDAIHLACAAGARVDLFLTHDQKLTKLYVPGIKFIEDFKTTLMA